MPSPARSEAGTIPLALESGAACAPASLRGEASREKPGGESAVLEVCFLLFLLTERQSHLPFFLLHVFVCFVFFSRRTVGRERERER